MASIRKLRKSESDTDTLIRAFLYVPRMEEDENNIQWEFMGLPVALPDMIDCGNNSVNHMKWGMGFSEPENFYPPNDKEQITDTDTI